MDFIAALRKDRIEYVRSKKGLICGLTLFFCCAAVLGMTLLLPGIVERLSVSTAIMNKGTSVTDFMRQFFPDDLSGSMKILAADIGVFYGITVVLLSYKAAPGELTSAKAILPFCAGYSRNKLLLSKQLTYSIMMAAPVYAFYMLYYVAASGFLTANYQIKDAAVNGFVLAFSIFVIINVTICLSMIYRTGYGVLLFMIGMIAAAPDVLSFFTIGKYLPTYLLTLTYRSNTEHIQLIIPFVTSMILLLFLEAHALLKQDVISLTDRR